MRYQSLFLLTSLFFSHQSFAGDIYGLSQNRLKLISESSQLRSLSDNLTVESISLLREDRNLELDSVYEIILRESFSDHKKCFLVNFEYLGSGEHQIVDISKCKED